MTRKPSKFFPQENEVTVSTAAFESAPTATAVPPTPGTVPAATAAVHPNDENLPEISVKAYPIEQSQQCSSVKTKSTKITLLGDCKLRSSRISSRNKYITLLGDHKIDLRKAQFPPSGDVYITIIKLAGDVKLIVPESVSVSVKAIMLCADKRIEEAAEASLSSSPHVKLTIINLCGDVVVTTTDENKKLDKALNVISTLKGAPTNEGKPSHSQATVLHSNVT